MKGLRFLNIVLQPCADACNLACDYCYVHHTTQPETTPISQMTSEFLSWYPHLLSALNESSLRFVRFTWHGGEPLLAGPEFFRQVRGLQRQHLTNEHLDYDNVIMTNGTLLDRSMIRLLDDENISIGVSCDGPTYAENRLRFRSPADYRLLEGGVRNLQAEGVDFSTVVVVSEANVRSPEAIWDMLTEYGPAHGVSITPCHGADSSPSPDEYAEFLIRLYHLWGERRHPAIALFENVELGLSYGVMRFCQLIGRRCRGFLTANYEGTLYSGCQRQEEFFVGKMREADWSELWATHLEVSEHLENKLQNPPLSELLGEQAPYLCFRGSGCPNRADGAGRDPYAASYAKLIEYVYASDRERFQRLQAERISELESRCTG